MEKKIEVAKHFILKNINILRCPLCGETFNLDNNSLICRSRHTFDISKKGYVNLFSGNTKIVKLYDKELFTARKKVSDSGLYKVLCKNIAEVLTRYNKQSFICDAGSGGGNVTFDIKNEIGKSDFIALDLSKDGVDFASVNYFDENILWLVGNLNEMPFTDNSFDSVINVMSPANYDEFKRILKPGGVLLKVLIEPGYLSELRHYIYGDSDKNEYSNSEVYQNLAQNMDIIYRLQVDYKHTLCGCDVAALFDMTPLTAEIGTHEMTREQIRRRFISENNDFTVSLAFSIVVCTNKKQA